MESTLSKTSSRAHDAVDSIAGAADQAVRKAKPAIEQVSAMAHEAVDKATAAAAPTADWLAEQGNSLATAQRKLAADTRSYISSNPMKAVGFALAAGLLISRILR